MNKIFTWKSELCIIISSLCDVDVNSISIVYADDDPGCLTKIKPLKSIVNIKIDNRDFNLFYNEQYNILHDDFKISMNKVFIYWIMLLIFRILVAIAKTYQQKYII